MLQVTESNYFSPEVESEYMGASQFKNFMDCEARTLAELKGEWTRQSKDAFMEGNFVEAYFEGNLDKFKEENPGMISSQGATKGQLKANYKHLYDVIKVGESDSLFMEYMQGEPQVIKTGEIAGVPFKIKIDRLHPDRIVDLKVMRDFNKQWKDGKYHNFIEYWGYDIQGAIYQKVEGGNKPFYIDGLTKEKYPDKAVIKITQDYLDMAMEKVVEFAPYFKMLKDGVFEPKFCGKCDYCKSVKKLDRVIEIGELDG